AMVVALITQHYVAPYAIPSSVMTFVLGGTAFALGAPIQMLMINTAEGSEMLAASVNQASFNMRHAVGAYLGGLPIAIDCGYAIPSLVMTFVLGGTAFALGAPIQMLMINTAKGSEMLAASVSQASFNIGNALGAFLGGLPIAMGYGYASPEWVGAAMAAGGAL